MRILKQGIKNILYPVTHSEISSIVKLKLLGMKKEQERVIHSKTEERDLEIIGLLQVE